MQIPKDLFDLSDVLGLRRQLATLVLGGKVFRLARAPMADSEPEFAELCGSRRRVEAAGEVRGLLSQTLDAHTGQVETFRARCLRLRPRPWLQVSEALKGRMVSHERLRFVFNRLIPRLRRLSSHPPLVDRSRAVGELRPVDEAFSHLSETDEVPRSLVEEVLGGDVLALGQSVYSVAWIRGNLRPRDCFLQAEGERYSVQKRQRRPLMALDRAFKARLKEALRGHIFDQENDRLLTQARAMEEDLTKTAAVTEENTTLYRDRERSVFVGKDGSIFCCQHVPPFVMEGSDRKLRLFQRVRVGVRLVSLKPQDVLPMDGAYVMKPYDHVFVFHFDRLGRLCMGHDYAFFERFWKMPLEEGILEYLNAARLVICAGYFDAGDDPLFLPTETEGRPKISLREARRRKLPVYRYYRA